jgi:hypothetical protein
MTSRTGSSRAIAFASESKRLIGFFVFDRKRPRSPSTYNVPRNASSFNRRAGRELGAMGLL